MKTHGSEGLASDMVAACVDTHVRNDLIYFVRRRLPAGEKHWAEDIVQDAMIRVLLYTQGREIEEPAKYLKKIVKRLTLNFIERWRPMANSVQLDDEKEGQMQIEVPGPGLEKQVEYSIDTEKYRRTLESLCSDASERECKLLGLRLQGLDSEQIALELGEPVEPIQTDLNRLFARIRARIKSRAKKSAPPKQKNGTGS